MFVTSKLKLMDLDNLSFYNTGAVSYLPSTASGVLDSTKSLIVKSTKQPTFSSNNKPETTVPSNSTIVVDFYRDPNDETRWVAKLSYNRNNNLSTATLTTTGDTNIDDLELLASYYLAKTADGDILNVVWPVFSTLSALRVMANDAGSFSTYGSNTVPYGTMKPCLFSEIHIDGINSQLAKIVEDSKDTIARLQSDSAAKYVSR